MAESFAAAAPYFRDLVKYDAVTALVIVVAALRGLLHGSWQMRPLALGLITLPSRFVEKIGRAHV